MSQFHTIYPMIQHPEVASTNGYFTNITPLQEVTYGEAIYYQLLHPFACHMNHMEDEVALHLCFMKNQCNAMQLWTSGFGLVETTFKYHIICQHKHLFFVKPSIYHPLLYVEC